MSAKRIEVVWGTGDVLFEGVSSLDTPDAYEEPCPPTKRSPGSGSGTFPAVSPVVTDEDDKQPETNRAA
jgi:hypothetical protein